MDVIASYIKSQWDNADKNRKDLQLKWETNREYFLGTTADQWKKDEAKGWRSSSFPGFTHQKVTFAMAMVLDTVLAGGEIPFMYKGSPFEKNRTRSMPTDPATVKKAIDDMTRLTRQQLVDCRAETAYMKNVLSAALYGWTYGKFIIQNVHREGYEEIAPVVPGIEDWSRLPENAKQWQKWEEDFMSPAWLYIPIWQIYRDWETDDLRACKFIMQCDIVSNHWMRQKKGKAYFIDQNIDRAIQTFKVDNQNAGSTVNGSDDNNKSLTPLQRDIIARVNTNKYREYWGRVPREQAEQFESELEAQTGFQTQSLTNDDDGDEVEISACTYNDEVTVRYVRTNPNMRPFFQAKWEDPGDELAPRGVADNCQQMHNVLKGTFRAIEDNMKLSSNVIIAIKERFLKNVPDEFKPGMKLLLTEDCDDARKAVQSVTIPNVTQPLMELLGTASQFLDDDSMVPKIAQGIREPGDQTAAEASMRQAAASKYMGMAIRNLDEGLVEPMITEFYNYNMNDPAIQVGKGNYLVQALGFTSFQNKTDRMKALQQMIAMALSNPALEKEVKVRYYLEEIAKALDMDPEQGLKTEEEKQIEGEQQANAPETQLQLAGMEAEVKKTESEAMKNESQAKKNLADAETAKLGATSKLVESSIKVQEMQKNDQTKPEGKNVGGGASSSAGAGR